MLRTEAIWLRQHWIPLRETLWEDQEKVVIQDIRLLSGEVEPTGQKQYNHMQRN